MKFKFEELRVYQYAVKLSNDIFTLTSKWPSSYRYSIADQLQRAALSISLNIAEGSSRTTKDFKHFLAIARGSCFECIPLLTIAHSQQLISNTEYDMLYNTIYSLAKMISGLRSKCSTKSHSHEVTK